MSPQDRPLSGLVTALTLQAGVLLTTAVAQTVHVLDPNALYVVDIFVNNPTGGATTVTLTVLGVAIAASVPARTTIQFLTEAPLRGSNAAGATNLITASGVDGQANGMVLWGRVRVM